MAVGCVARSEKVICSLFGATGWEGGGWDRAAQVLICDEPGSGGGVPITPHIPQTELSVNPGRAIRPHESSVFGAAYIKVVVALHPLPPRGRINSSQHTLRLERGDILVSGRPRLLAFDTGASLASFPATMSSSMNRYWIPHWDIQKRVITQELQYYLGPQATVRPYTLEVLMHRCIPFVDNTIVLMISRARMGSSYRRLVPA